MSRKKKGILIGAIGVVLIAGALLIRYLLSVEAYRTGVANISIENRDASGVSDGSYEGDWDVGMIYAKVRVAVQNGRITQIDLLEHRNDRGAAAESIPECIVAAQRIDVDAVSGATNSSRVIKKAVDQAIEAGKAAS